MSDNQYSIADHESHRVLIRRVSEVDFAGWRRLVRELRHDALVDRVCNRIPKTWSDKR